MNAMNSLEERMKHLPGVQDSAQREFSPETYAKILQRAAAKQYEEERKEEFTEISAHRGSLDLASLYDDAMALGIDTALIDSSVAEVAPEAYDRVRIAEMAGFKGSRQLISKMLIDAYLQAIIPHHKGTMTKEEGVYSRVIIMDERPTFFHRMFTNYYQKLPGRIDIYNGVRGIEVNISMNDISAMRRLAPAFAQIRNEYEKYIDKYVAELQ